MIMIYVVIKCQMPEIYAHIKLANRFATNSLKSTKLGYYWQTLSTRKRNQAAVLIAKMFAESKKCFLES